MDIEERLRDALSGRAALVRNSKGTSPVGNTRKSQSRRNLAITSAVLLSAGLIALVALGLDGRAPQPAGVDAVSVPAPPDGIRVQFGTDPYNPTYPSSYEVSNVSAAQASSSFSIVVPDTTWTQEAKLIGIYSLPGGAVALDYAAPTTPKSYIRQAYLEVYEAAWDPKVDPLTWYKANLAGFPNPDSSIVDIGGHPALVVKPHSSVDPQHANPAFVRVVANGIEFQVSGGEDLSRVESIALALVKSAAS